MMLKYKLESYRKEDNKLWTSTQSNSIEPFLKELNRPYTNYYHRLYENISRRWIDITDRQDATR